MMVVFDEMCKLYGGRFSVESGEEHGQSGIRAEEEGNHGR